MLFRFQGLAAAARRTCAPHGPALAFGVALAAIPGCGGSSVGVLGQPQGLDGGSVGFGSLGGDDGSPGNPQGGGASASGTLGTGAMSATAQGGVGAPLGHVACGSDTCDARTQVCCVSGLMIGGQGQTACTPTGQCSPESSASLSCSSASSCPSGQACCLAPGTSSADLYMGSSAICQTSCANGQPQLCENDSECPRGLSCQGTSDSFLKSCRDVPPASSDLAPSGAGATPGSCVTTIGPSNDTTYQATCACPQGTCACFGPSSTSVIHFDGCPFCPETNSVGTTTPEHIFSLCGFPL